VNGQPAPDFSVKPALTGEKVVLRPFIADDIPALRAAMQDPEVLRLTGSVHDDNEEFGTADPTRDEQFRQWRNAQSDRLDLAVVDKTSGQCVGEVGFVREGVLREALRFNGEWIDATVMSILAPEWARHRGRP
jgi:RimJ/RimL family protein N-acetyltransferase